MTAERGLDPTSPALSPLQRYVGSWQGEVTLQVGSAQQRQSFRGSAELGGGRRMLAEDRLLGPDTYEWSFAVLAADVSVLTRSHAREQRVPAPVTAR